ncbi:MAG: Fe-S cluster assembly protein SufD [Xanthomonadales bacterium]|jgi:Fe-S cluster assembly protein SufD|nr:Fe-S cluster assembly protein SufD [Xanthomonadales bacterium]
MNTSVTQGLAERWAGEVRAVDFPLAPEWLQQLRGQATGRFAADGLPHRKVEAWKYTPLKRLEALAPGLPAGNEPAGAAAVQAPLLENNVFTVDIVDGRVRKLPGDTPAGLTVLKFEDALKLYENRIRGLAEQVELSGPGHAFAALNTAYLHRSLVVHVEKNTDGGSLLVRWSAGSGEEKRFESFRLFVLLDDGARLELVEQHLGGGPAGALNMMVQSQLGENSRLDHVRVQTESEDTVLLTSTSVEQAAGSHYGYAGFDLGGGLVRHELYTKLGGNGATTDLSGACVLDGSRHGDTHISVDHAAPDCRSEQFFRGVLGGSSRGVFNGRALIRKGADGSSVQQSNANLLLSPLAEIDTKPELEIYADEVEASHGATVGQLDETAVFYLRSRGLSDAEARHMLTAAFCHAVSSRLKNRELAEKVGRLVDAAMPGRPGSG